MKQKTITFYGTSDDLSRELNVAIDMGWFVHSITKSLGSDWLIVMYKP